MKKALLLGLLPLFSCSTIPGCPTTFCDIKEDLTYYGRNVRVLYEDGLRQAGSCALRAELTTGAYVPSTEQEAITILRNLAGQIHADALVMQTFRANKEATGRAYVCTGGQNQATVISSDRRTLADVTGRDSRNPEPQRQDLQPDRQRQPEPQQNVILEPSRQTTQTPSQSRITVTDRARRLTWQQCSMGQQSQGGRCQGTATAEMYQTAAAFCASLSSGSVQYRLPDRGELAALLRENASGPKIDASAFPDTKADIYWTRESYNNSPITNWVVDFGGGGSFGYGTDNQAYTRCVAQAP